MTRGVKFRLGLLLGTTKRFWKYNVPSSATVKDGAFPFSDIPFNLLDIRVTCLYPPNGFVVVRFNNQVIYMTLRNNLEVYPSKLFIQKRLLYLNFKFTTVG